MLAHLAYWRRPNLLASGFMIALLAYGLARAHPAWGADTLPLGALDARATGKVSSAEVLERGTLTTGLSVEAAETVVDRGLMRGDDGVSGDGRLLRDANRASVFFGAAVADNLEMTLGLHGSFEHVKPDRRDALFANASASLGEDASWRHGVKQSGFAGASLLLKLKLVDWRGLGLAFAPFVESGAGDQASFALTRSVGPKAGFVTIATYGAPGVAELSLNLGARYRDAEELGDVAIRNEQFARASLRAYASRTFALFVAGEGRRLMIADADEIDIESSKRVYAPSESGDVKGGFQVGLGDAELSVFAGGMPKHAGGFGFGKRSFGMGLATSIGRPARSIAAEIEAREAAKAQELAAKKPASPQPVTVDPYPEMIGADVDPLEALGQEVAPDFKDEQVRRKQYEADAHVESEDARVERELKELRSAEEQAAKEREKIESLERAKRHKSAVKKHKEDEELMKEWIEEAQEETSDIPGISTDEANWNGLE